MSDVLTVQDNLQHYTLELLPDAEHAVDVLVAAVGPRGAAPEVVIILITSISVTPAPARPVSSL